MSVLVYVENQQGRFKKSAFETISFGAAIASQSGSTLAVVSVGEVADEELSKLSKYGASLILSVKGDSFNAMNVQPYATAIATAARHVQAKVVVLSASFSGKAIAPRVAVKLEAALGDNLIELPKMDSAFVVKRNAYSGKAYAFVELLTDVKVLSILPNSYKVVESPVSGSIEQLSVQLSANDTRLSVKETVRATDKVSLPEAELVVSAGRGMKGPENWGMIEQLADVLGAATACSKPVSDAGWRPHSEHVGQTGIAISPNLYIAVGISGAIQHLAGVSSSKVIVVVNKDPEAPFFKAADYGIVGDLFEVVPKLTAAVKALKASQH
ncbi:MAG: electron transfer flavoprotein subunit alpha/FixB family protein [Bacteroidota bacterium]